MEGPCLSLTPKRHRRLRAGLAIATFLAGAAALQAQAAQDAVARLLQRIAAREVTLTGSDRDILRTVLRELDVPIESQLAVFSHTSAQRDLIRPSRPRALYFSDSVYVGWVPTGLIEAIAIDPARGPVFYAFDPQDARDNRRTFVRETSCARCHAGTFRNSPPVLVARSIVTGRDGEPLFGNEGNGIDDSTPFEQLWGGWYVTGYTGTTNHRGNAFGSRDTGKFEFQPSEKRPVDLTELFDTASYLAPTSDVVALLVFEHQLAVQNSLFRAGHRMWQTTEAELEQDLASTSEDVLDHLLFRNAAPLPSGIQGSDAFRRVFAADARRSAHGDSLKDLSLDGRLFANRCSFMIYSASFAALPAPLKERVFDRLAVILRGDKPPERYAYLQPEEKRRIWEILTETLPEAQKRR